MSTVNDSQGSGGKTRIFISAATKEFRSLRLQLAASLHRSGFEVEHQDIFPQTNADTLPKLEALLKGCRLVIHLVGHKPGSVANEKSLADLLAKIPPDTLLPEHPELHNVLGDFTDITYTQWEAFLALHFKVPLLVYAPADAEGNVTFSQKDHLARLKLGRKYPEWCSDEADYFAKILPDVTRELGIQVAPIEQKIAPPKFLNHAAEDFLGREDELALLDHAWDDSTELVNVLSFIAWGGVGKTALLAEWIQRRFIAREWLDDQGEVELWRYFDWSFYEQGTVSSYDDEAVRTGSMGDFFERALDFFGDPDPNLPGKGARLARLVQQQRSLLILDGMEPLQQPFNHPQAGQLIDNDLHDLLCALALKNPGFCVVTSRQSLADLSGLRHGASQESKLSELPIDTAIRLLRNLQIKGSDEELEEASEAFGRHALSLTLLGRFLCDAHGGDIRKRDLIDLHEADDATRPDRNRTAWKVLEVYDAWLATAGDRPGELATLRLTGLFDRPARADCLAALRAGPVIPSLTEDLAGLSEPRWNILLTRLERAKLIVLREDENGAKGIDAHPLIREYFSKQLRDQQPEAFREAHSRLFDHLCENTEHQPETLAGLQPLYQAVVHGCLAGRQQEAREKVYAGRIQRGTGDDGFYSWKKLGAIGADLGAVAAFFDQPWGRLSPNLSQNEQGWLLNEAALRLRALGRLAEASEPMAITLAKIEKTEQWSNASVVANNLGELNVTLGRLAEAEVNARRAIDFADRSLNRGKIIINLTTAGEALSQRGERDEALSLFTQAETLQRQDQPVLPLLYSWQGFRYCDFILIPNERSAWLAFCFSYLQSEDFQLEVKTITDVERRSKTTLNWMVQFKMSLLDIALDHLTLTRVALYRALLGSPYPDIEYQNPHLLPALDGIRKSGQIDWLPKALLTAAWHEHFTGDPDAASRHLDEAQQIAERGPMPLYLADVHLHRARLFHDKAELTKAATLIHKHKYGRRYEELTDAETASANW